jgi:plastocyanin
MIDSLVQARIERRFRWTLAGALLVGLLAGVFIPRLAVQARDSEPQTYTVFAGGSNFYNTAVLAFAPQSLQVHRGDTVTWVMGFHNIHFEQGPADLIIAPEVDGKPLPQINPAVAFPNVQSGSAYQGGDANSGLPLDPANAQVTFSLMMDLEPGSYGYFCDIHHGMVGTITVVDAATPIPSPAEALQTGATELAASGGQGLQAAAQAAMQAPTETEGGGLQVQAGLQSGLAAVLQFFPSVAVIEVGQSVTWSMPSTSMEPHTITWPPLPPGSEVSPVAQDGGPPILALGPSMTASVESGAEIGTGDSFNSGFLLPGQSFTLKFTEPGVYNYVCALHSGMQGAVVVMPAS